MKRRRPQSLRSPRSYHHQQNKIHMCLTHQPFQSWCRVCQQVIGLRRPTSPMALAGRRTPASYSWTTASTRDPHQQLNDLETSHLHHPYSYRVYDGTLHRSAYFSQRVTLHIKPHNYIIRLRSKAHLYKEHLTVRCRNSIDAVGQHQSLQTSTYLQ